MTLLTAPSRDELQAFLFGSLSDEQAADMMERIDRHPAARVLLDELSQSDDSLAAELKEVLPLAPYLAEAELTVALDRANRAFARFETISKSSGAEATAELRDPRPPLSPPAAALSEQLREYSLLEKLGEGGMGAVYKARHTRLDKIVAVKLLHADRMKNAESVARFNREMKAVGRLDHPNIVRATDAGEVDGTHFLVMEHVAGSDLSRVQHELGPFPVADACEVVRQTAVGLQHAHEHGLVHRDLKPGNLMLAKGVVKILDLGLARLQSEQGVGELTTDGQVMGTVDYMAPEQAADTHGADIRADIYSLGCTLYKLLTGGAPFGGTAYPTLASKILAHATRPARPIAALRADVPAALAAVLDKMLAKTRDDRYATPAELAAALAPFCHGADLAALVDPASQRNELRSTTSEAAAQRNEFRSTPVAAAGTVVRNEFRSPQSAGGRFGGRRVKIAWGTGGLAALVAAALVIRVQTDRGELLISSPDPNVQVTIKRNGESVEELTITAGNKTVSVRSGDVEVVLTGAQADSYVVKNDRVTLTRGKTAVVTIERVTATAAPPTPEVSPSAANRQVAQWVLEHGGWVWIENVPGHEIYVQKLAQLPDEVVRISQIQFMLNGRPVPPISEGELITKLRQLRGDLSAFLTNQVALTDAGIAELTRIPALAQLDYFQVHGVTISDTGLSQLKSWSNLGSIWVMHAPITGLGLADLRELPRLKMLWLPRNRLSDAGIAELRGMSLDYLDLGWNPGVTDAGIAHLAEMRSLRHLQLNGTGISDQGLKSLRGLSELETLQIGGTPVTEKGLAIIPAFQKLRHLGISDLPTTNAVFKLIYDLPDLESISLVGGKSQLLPADLLSLQKVRKLKSLGIPNSPQVTDEWLVPIGQLTTLTQLDLKATSVTAAGVEKLHAALPGCRIDSDHGTFEPVPEAEAK